MLLKNLEMRGKVIVNLGSFIPKLCPTKMGNADYFCWLCVLSQVFETRKNEMWREYCHITVNVWVTNWAKRGGHNRHRPVSCFQFLFGGNEPQSRFIASSRRASPWNISNVLLSMSCEYSSSYSFLLEWCHANRGGGRVPLSSFCFFFQRSRRWGRAPRHRAFEPWLGLLVKGPRESTCIMFVYLPVCID